MLEIYFIIQFENNRDFRFIDTRALCQGTVDGVSALKHAYAYICPLPFRFHLLDKLSSHVPCWMTLRLKHCLERHVHPWIGGKASPRRMPIGGEADHCGKSHGASARWDGGMGATTKSANLAQWLGVNPSVERVGNEQQRLRYDLTGCSTLAVSDRDNATGVGAFSSGTLSMCCTHSFSSSTLVASVNRKMRGRCPPPIPQKPSCLVLEGLHQVQQTS